ncbi:hypothetical protein MSG28_007498 [Choristoneura fumiferana]|uniref:Uncharacterized protein n=1 Tax=Choristoneura fumiferana TaxID=7141 RepID=A0ACC0JXX1_CHOFU|nr:hypothetical protein MSG28_007498 [Choristoneura fumiferana]
MHQFRRFIVLVTIVTYCLEAQGADKYTDENRPYEFGFTIDGEQHRHEKKDENGLIMGEFGFITADGVYHVTVYATDENGNFKIISMKNIRVKPYPTSPQAAIPARQGQSLPFPPSQQAPTVQGPSSQQPTRPLSSKPAEAAPVKSCSSCSIPTTTTQAPRITDFANVARDPLPSSVLGTNPASRPVYPQAADGYQNFPQKQPAAQGGSGSPNYPQAAGGVPNYPQGQQNTLQQGVNYPQQGQAAPQPGPNYQQQGQNFPQQGQNSPQGGQNYPQPGQNFPQQGQNSPQGGKKNPQQGQNYPQPGQNSPALQPPHGDRNPKQIEPRFGEPGQQNNQVGPGPIKPQLISAQMQIVDKNTDVNYKAPGEKEGLPNGLTKDDMMTLLYTFNYTVGFHGHHEEGYTNGAKKGYYYVTGRNGVRTRVDYVADENGFRPKITQEVLDLLSEDVPKPETEKDEKYGLKGYEFKWLYYPVESRKR